MTTRLPFSDLVLTVHASTAMQQLQPVSATAVHIRVPEQSRTPFIAPDFDIEESEFDVAAPALLISAPAAVGKSSLADELGRKTGNLVWDLSRFSVGSGFFTGTLYDTFGTAGLDIVRSALEAGETTLILDAADEALVQAGARNFESAIENLATLIRFAEHPEGSPSLGPSVVILGRPDTIDDTKRYLSEHGISAQIARVAFFDEPQARRFVKAKAVKTDRPGVAAAELDEFLKHFFDIVRGALGSGTWNASESFLGYAPVLDALGAFYRDESNPMQRLSEINQGQSSTHVWDLLVKVVESVLDREADKFGRSFGAGNERKTRFGKEAYDQRSQLELLLSDVPTEVEIDPPLDDDVDDSWVFEELTPRVQAQFREHPFLNGADSEPNPLLRFASVAFRDYSLARAMSEGDTRETSRLLDLWSDPRVAPSPMLSRFAMSSSLGITGVSVDAVTAIADSHASGFQPEVRLEIEVEPMGDTTRSAVEVTLIERSLPVGSVSSILDANQPLRLARSVARTSIESPDRSVVTGSGFQDFSIGPEVSIDCAQFDSESAEVRIRTSDGEPNKIKTGRILGSTRRVLSPDLRALEITVPAAAFPWQSYRSADSASTTDSDSSLYWVGMEVRKNTRWFARESMVAGGLNYPVDAMETILGKGRASRRVHDFWLANGYLVKRASYWTLEFPGFSTTVVLDNDLSNPAYRGFLTKFTAWLSQT